MQSPLLTIAIITYDRPREFEEALDSILAARAAYADQVEIIVCDDSPGSETAEIVAARNVPELRYIHSTANRGVLWNIHNCFEIASGRYVWCFSDDDALEANALGLVMPALWRAPSLLISNYSMYDAALRTIRKRSFYSNTHDHQSQDAGELLRLYHFNVAMISAVIVERDVLGKDSFAILDQFQSTGFSHVAAIYRGLLSKPSWAYIGTPLVKYRSNNARSYTWGDYFIVGAARVFDDLERQGYPESDVAAARNRHLKQYLLMQVIVEKALGGDTTKLLRQARQHFAKSWVFWLLCLPAGLMPAALPKAARTGIRTLRAMKATLRR
jgi:glycosyltransferase involved in cell wall biosynthesis